MNAGQTDNRAVEALTKANHCLQFARDDLVRAFRYGGPLLSVAIDPLIDSVCDLQRRTCSILDALGVQDALGVPDEEEGAR